MRKFCDKWKTNLNRWQTKCGQTKHKSLLEFICKDKILHIKHYEIFLKKLKNVQIFYSNKTLQISDSSMKSIVKRQEL